MGAAQSIVLTYQRGFKFPLNKNLPHLHEDGLMQWIKRCKWLHSCLDKWRDFDWPMWVKLAHVRRRRWVKMSSKNAKNKSIQRKQKQHLQLSPAYAAGTTISHPSFKTFHNEATTTTKSQVRGGDDVLGGAQNPRWLLFMNSRVTFCCFPFWHTSKEVYRYGVVNHC